MGRTPADEKSYFCERCKKVLKESQFYSSNNLEKYPDGGKLKLCRHCITAHVDNWKPETYLWILEECDVPYIPDVWNELLSRYGQNKRVTGATILGRYLSTMKLNQWSKYRWADSAYLQSLADKKVRETMERQGYSESEIDETLRTGRVTVPEPPPEEMVVDPQPDYFDTHGAISVDQELDLDLTQEELLALRLKWGKTYRPEEWVRLEQLYNEMTQSYDIQTAGHIDTLKLVCKTSLKANQLLDIGDVDGAQKMVKMYDSLMRSGKFTAAQNKAESGEYVDSVSELVAICETEGFIPRYYTDGPQDKVDRVLQDLQHYTRTLVTEEMNLGNLIEGAVRQIEADKEKESQAEAEAANEDELLEEALFAEQDGPDLQDQDFAELYEQEDAFAAQDDELLSLLAAEGV